MPHEKTSTNFYNTNYVLSVRSVEMVHEIYFLRCNVSKTPLGLAAAAACGLLVLAKMAVSDAQTAS